MCICQDGSSILDGGVLCVCSCQREEELEAVLCLPQRIPALLWTGTVVMSSHLYIHVHTCTCMYTYIVNCQLGKATHCTFMCTFLERIKCKEASFRRGSRERGNLQLVIVGRKQCTCTMYF